MDASHTYTTSLSSHLKLNTFVNAFVTRVDCLTSVITKPPGSPEFYAGGGSVKVLAGEKLSGREKSNQRGAGRTIIGT